MGISGLTFYKTAFVVADLRVAVERFDALGHYDWREVPSAPRDYRIGDEIVQLTTSAVISNATPRIHLLQEIPGTPWASSPLGAAHHVAYLVDDMDEAVPAMKAAGFRIECTDAGDPTGTRTWAYFVAPDGLRIELLGRPSLPDPAEFIPMFPVFTSAPAA